jgi:flagellar M-ring protein FliF
VNGFAALLRSLGPGRLASMGAVALGLIGFFAYIILRFNAVVQAPLYTGLTMEDSSAIVRELEAQNIPFTLAENGSVVMVGDADVLRLRMQLAEQGLPAGGGVGYEIFDKTDALGTTSFVQSVNALRALEGELSRTIRTIRRVEQARVHLVLPERQLFRQDEQKPTASIVLKTRGVLDASQIRAIQHLVASAVPNLEPSRISVVDESGRLLAEGSGDEGAAFLASSVDERTLAVQRQVEERVRDIVESVVGAGRARVRVAAELDMNRVQETRDTFDPNGQVVRSTQTREDASTSQDNQPSDQVTAGNQLPNANTGNGNAGASQTNQNANTTEEVVNYEISKVSRTQITEIGGLKRLSVAVLVDGRYATDPAGTQTYAPRPQEELDQISALVRTAMGFDQNRGDQLQVVNLQFAEGPAVPTEEVTPGLFDFTKDDLVRFAEMGVMLVLSLLVLLFAVRPLIRRITAPETSAEASEAAAAAAAAATIVAGTPGSTTIVIGPNGQQIPVEIGADGKPLPVLIENAGPPSRIDEAKAQGALQMDQIRRVGELVGENPNEAAILIRTWLGEAA